MRVAVISDIHANLHALEAVLAAIDADPVDELWCLGDLVGYGPKPNECCALVAGARSVCLCGNHDLAVRGTIDLVEFSGDAGPRRSVDARRADRRRARVPRRASSPRARPPASRSSTAAHATRCGSTCSPTRRPRRRFTLTEEPLVLVGHSHAALQIALRERSLEGGLAPAGTELDLAGARWLLNPGSVGQPRDGDPRAAYLLLDLDAQHGELPPRRVRHRVDAVGDARGGAPRGVDRAAGRRPMKHAPLLLVTLLSAGCGATAKPTAGPPLPRALAQRWAQQAEAIATASPCAAHGRATALRTDVILAVNRRKIPQHLLEPLTSKVNALAAHKPCAPVKQRSARPRRVAAKPAG